jgi:amino acid transporter
MTLEPREKKSPDRAEDEVYPPSHDVREGELVSAGSQHLHRKLRGREVQLFAVGGAIGTCMHPFVISATA